VEEAFSSDISEYLGAMMSIYRNDVDGKDFFIEHNGSIILLRPVTDAARYWTDEHIPQEAMWWSGALVVEPVASQTSPRAFNSIA
jgi:hypothetical protein